MKQRHVCFFSENITFVKCNQCAEGCMEIFGLAVCMNATQFAMLVGCVGYNVFQVVLYKTYLGLMTGNNDAFFKTQDVYYSDQLSKSILSFHHYASCIMLVFMRLV